MPRIALVTARAAEALDTDLAPLASALTDAGATPLITCWDDPSAAWDEFDLAVLRSAWDYPYRIAEFLGWVDSTSRVTTLVNDPATIRWNVDKHYLADLGAHGTPTVPTTYVLPGEPVNLPAGQELVLKPTVSAGARHTARFEPDDVAATAFAESLLERGLAVMVQPYQSAVDTDGERALVCFDGAFSHVFRKGPILRPGVAPTTDLFADEQIDVVTATPGEITLAERAVETAAGIVGAIPLYARVDLVPGADGSPHVLELELVEPSVYHHVDPASARRFAEAILRRTTGPD